MGVLFRAGELYQEMWKAIIRPPRDYYGVSELGPPCFLYEGRRFKRRDFELKNSRGHKLQCSHFEPVQKNGNYLTTSYPCVIYLHGNCSSRLEALNCGCLRALLPQGISVLCFDFSGCGLSEGEYVSLGWFERQDLESVRHIYRSNSLLFIPTTQIVEHLRDLGRISTIGLWGRSMGAVTACMFADTDPTIAGLVVDSPFASLRKLAEELAADFVGWRLPKLLLNPALNMVRSTIQARAKFDLDDLQPIEHCKQSYTPALFVAAKDDVFIRPHHCREMHDVYPGDKNFIMVEGGHNSPRPSFLQDSISIFFRFALQALTTLGPTNSLNGSMPTAVWEEVATSLAAVERQRRKRLTLEGQKRKSTSSRRKQRHHAVPQKIDHLDENISSSHTVADSSLVVSPETFVVNNNNDDDDDETALDNAIGQRAILESIQVILSRQQEDDKLDITEIHDIDLEHLIDGVLVEGFQRQDNPSLNEKNKKYDYKNVIPPPPYKHCDNCNLSLQPFKETTDDDSSYCDNEDDDEHKLALVTMDYASSESTTTTGETNSTGSGSNTSMRQKDWNNNNNNNIPLNNRLGMQPPGPSTGFRW